MKIALDNAFRAIALMTILIAAAPGAVAQIDGAKSPAAQPASSDVIADTQVDVVGCVAACPSCGSAEAACGCQGDANCCGPDCCQKRCVVYCDPEDYVCCPHTEKETVEKECWTVQCEAICIPKFHMPWECCSKPKCGRIRCINVLGKEKYECEECVTTWEAKRVGCGRCGCSDGCGDGCCDPGCGRCAKTDGSAQPSDVQTVSAELPADASKGDEEAATAESNPESRWSKLLFWRK